MNAVTLPVTVNVTREDIEHGRPRDAEFCPTALACRRALGPAAPRVKVLSSKVGLSSHDGRAWDFYAVDDAVQTWIRAYDEDEQGLQPFSFELGGAATSLVETIFFMEDHPW